MQKSLIAIVAGLLLTIGGLIWWQMGLGGSTLPPDTPAPRAATDEAAPAAVAPMAAATLDANAGASDVAAVAGERTAVALEAALDASRPVIRGRVVGVEGKPLAGIRVLAAPGLAFANADGDFSFDSFDPADLEEVGAFDQTAMLELARTQLLEQIAVVTDAEGSFRIQPRGSSRGVGLRVLAPGYELLDRRVSRPVDQDVDAGTLQLRRGAIVRGRVEDGQGKAVAEVRVRRVLAMEDMAFGGLDLEIAAAAEVEERREGETAITGADGRFELLHVPAGPLQLRARHRLHPSVRQRDLTVEVGVDLEAVVIKMPLGFEIRGRVLGIPEGMTGLQVLAARKQRADADPTGMMGMFGGEMVEAMADAGMPIGDRTVEVARDGQFVLQGLARDTFRLHVTQPDRGLAGSSVCSARLEVEAGAHGIELRYEPGRQVTLRVVDAATDAPIERLWVHGSLRGTGFDFMAMQQGAAKLRDYPDGLVTIANLRPKAKQTLTIEIEAIGYARHEREGLLLPLQGPLDLGIVRLEPRPVIEVTVRAADTGEPVAGATVRLVAADDVGGSALERLAQPTAGPGSGRSDRTGRCVLNRLDPEAVPQVRVVVDSRQFATYTSEPFALAADGAAVHEVRLLRGGRLELAAVTHDDQLLAAAVVEHRSPLGAKEQHKADAEGKLRLERLPPGEHAFRIGRDAGLMGRWRMGGNGEGESWQSVSITEGGVAQLVLKKPPHALVSGIVRELGVPLAEATITFVDGAGQGVEAIAMEMAGDMAGGMFGGGRSGKSDDAGRYRIEDLPAGSHRLRVRHRSRALPTEIAVTLQIGDNTFDIDLSATELRGFVRDPDGLPVVDAKVTVREGGAGAVDVGGIMQDMMPGFGGGGSSAKTDEGGAFTLRGIPVERDLTVHATAKGYAAATAPARVAADGMAPSVVVQLGRAGKLKVIVPTEEMFVMVSADFETGDERAGATSVNKMLPKGKGTFDGLKPGRWKISYRTISGGGADDDADEAARTRTVEVVANETVTVQF
jgi:hypothetical protein